MIYFIQVGDNGPIKIGVTKNISTRLAALRVGQYERLEVIGIKDGDRKEEAKIHDTLDSFRLKNEWFRPSPEVLDFIRENTYPFLDNSKNKKPGRRPGFVKMLSFTLRIKPTIIEQLKQEAGDIPISVILRRLIEKYIKGEVGLD